MNDPLNAACRVAFAALMHDLGKFAERAAIFSDHPSLETHEQLYCRRHELNGRFWYTHKHAAHTALALDEIEKRCPDLVLGDTYPFTSRQAGSDATDSLANAASMHHKPDTFLQWIIATADRVASGFERDEFERYNAAEDKTDTGRNHYQARQLTLFEQIRVDEKRAAKDTSAKLEMRYPLKALSPESIFPVNRDACEPGSDAPAKAEYRELWEQFLGALAAIPASHRSNWPLWLDHFDTAWLTFTHAIPSATAFGVKPEVSLYDHCKTTAALSTALWLWHESRGQCDLDAVAGLRSRGDWDEKKLLLIQGDFFGIQEFIFSEGSQTNKAAARLLRGRSFQISLFTELAALRILDACELPPTSQIINAAGKFLIVAPNTEHVKAKLAAVRDELNTWFLEHSYGLSGLGLVAKPVACNDLLKGRFGELISGLFADLERAKFQRFSLTGDACPVMEASWPMGVCPYNGRLPADEKGSASLSRDQIKLGTALARSDRLLVMRNGESLRGDKITRLEAPIFGYHIVFTGDQEISGKFGPIAQSGTLVRCWDFGLPTALDATLWNGYARRNINAYVPRFSEADAWASDKYGRWESEVDFDPRLDAGKTLNHIACEDREPRRDRFGWEGQIALMTLKGDVDDLGLIFQKGLAEPTFAKTAALSRQMNAFFAVWLPAYCASAFPNTYTVFAGGDDFFLIGPWHSTQRLAADMAAAFKVYVAANPDIHFSVGMVMTKPGLPIDTLATQAEEALAAAKGGGKNALTLFGENVRWDDWPRICAAQQELQRLSDDYALSTGYIYSLLHLIDLASDSSNPESPLWRSRFAYRTRRYVVDKLRPAQRQSAQQQLSVALGENGIAQLKTRYRIPLFNHFYRQR